MVSVCLSLGGAGCTAVGGTIISRRRLLAPQDLDLELRLEHGVELWKQFLALLVQASRFAAFVAVFVVGLAGLAFEGAVLFAGSAPAPALRLESLAVSRHLEPNRFRHRLSAGAEQRRK